MEIDLPAPEKPEPPYGRRAHPYFLHDMIRSEPFAVHSTVRDVLLAVDKIPRPPTDRPLLFVGMGTSFHAARAGAWAAGVAFDHRQPIRAVDSFDLLLEPELIRRAGMAIVFSSSGETALTHRAQEALGSAGVPRVLVTGTVKSRSVERADHVLLTREASEKAWVHTVSYVTAIAATLTLLRHWSGNAAVDPRPAEGALAAVVDREEEWRALADLIGDRRELLLLGSGPAEATAREASLKLREGAARFVTSAGVEEFLHGILPSVDPTRAAAFAIATAALDRRRAVMSLRAAARAGAKSVLFARGSPTGEVETEFTLPIVPPATTPIVDIVPFQFLTYWLALAAHRNPDVMGYDDPRIFAARETYGI